MLATVVLLTLAPGLAAQDHDRIIGLLTLPEVFGAGPCDPFKPYPVTLYAAPQGGQLGTIQVDNYWTLHGVNGAGGCEGLEVNVHLRGSSTAPALPTEEYTYEAPAAIVLEQRGRWFRVRLRDGSAWVNASERDVFHPLEELLTDSLTSLTESWDRMLASEPGGAARVRVPSDPRRRVVGYLEPQLEVVEVVLGPGQDVEDLRRRYRPSHVGSRPGPNGTRIVSLETGASVPLFDAPDPGKPPSATGVETHRAGESLTTLGSNHVVVVDHRPGWFQVMRRGDWREAQRYWLRDSAHWRYHPVKSDGEAEQLENQVFPHIWTVRTTEFRRLGDELWVLVEILSDSPCHSRQVTVMARGWIRAHATSGEPTIWFSPRGC
jgi:hypothetical protein